MSKFTCSFMIIFLGLLLGYVIQLLVRHRRLELDISLDDLRQILQKAALLIVNPVAIVGAVWIVNLNHATLIALPFIGLFTYLAGGALAVGASRLLDLDGKRAGALFCCGFFINIGAIGTLICYIFLGEAGFAMVAIFKLFQEVAYYAMKFRKISAYLRECMSISLIKFILVPVLACLPAFLLGYGNIQNGLPLKTVW